jgi:phage terminase large subunit-like protein
VKVSRVKLRRSVCRESYTDFLRTFWPILNPHKSLDWNWHIDLMCEEIQDLVENLIAGRPRPHNLVCNISPGSTKSTCFSQMLAPWAWTRAPWLSVGGFSYTDEVALFNARKSRDIIRSDLYRETFPEIVIRNDQDRQGNFANTLGGMRYSCGVGGMILSFHFDIQVLDDPIDPLGALSKADLASVNYWIKNALYPRALKDKANGFLMLVMQRLAQGDPTEEVASIPGTRWLRVPCSTEFMIQPAELAAFYQGGLMDPVRLSRTMLDGVRDPKAQGESGYSSQYGQDPIPIGGGMFNTAMLRWGNPPEHFVRMIRAWDKAVTPEKGAGFIGRQPAFTVGTLMAIDHEGREWVLDVRRFRKDSAGREATIAHVARVDGYGVIVAVEKEPGSGGTDSAEATAKRLRGYRVKLVTASGSKESRADDFSHAMNSGLIYLPAELRSGNSWIGWAHDWVEEHKYAPHGRYVDQMDSAALGHTVLTRKKVIVGPLV